MNPLQIPRQSVSPLSGQPGVLPGGGVDLSTVLFEKSWYLLLNNLVIRANEVFSTGPTHLAPTVYIDPLPDNSAPGSLVLLNALGTGNIGVWDVNGFQTTGYVLAGAASSGSAFAFKNTGGSFSVDNDGNIVSLSSSLFAIQAPNGGILAEKHIATVAMAWTENTAAAAGPTIAGVSRLYMDSTSHQFLLSQNAGAYFPVATVQGSNKQLQYNNSGASGATVGLEWDHSTSNLTFSAGTFLNVLDTSTAAIQASVGGVTAAKLIGTTYWVIAEDTLAHAGGGAAGLTKIYMDSSTHVVMINQNNAGYVPLLGGGSGGITIGTTVITSGTDTRLLFDDAGVVQESAALFYLKAFGFLNATAFQGNATSTNNAFSNGTGSWVARGNGDSAGRSYEATFTSTNNTFFNTSGNFTVNGNGLVNGASFQNNGGSFTVNSSGDVTLHTLTRGSDLIIDSTGNITAPSTKAIKAQVTGSTVGFLLANNNFLVNGNGDAGFAGNVGISGALDVTGNYEQGGSGLVIINTSHIFVGAGVDVGNSNLVKARRFDPYNSGGVLQTGQDYSLSFNSGTQKLKINGSDVNTVEFIGGAVVSTT